METLKEKILGACRHRLFEKLSSLDMASQHISGSMETETKSPLGDKHETARARMQSELELIERQKDELKKQLNELEKITFNGTNENIFAGSLVETNRGFFFIAVPPGKIKVDKFDMIVVSPQSPIGRLFMGLQKHAEFTMKDMKYRVLNIY